VTPRADATKVLVVDDEPAIRLIVRVNLEAEGMAVLEAEDGAAGVGLAHAERPDALLLDVMMPGLDGWAVAEAVLGDERTKETGIVFLTGRAELRERALGLGLAGVDYLTKPFDPSQLGAVVRGVLARPEGCEPLRRESIARLRRLAEA
jgi:DNA-binding response OmpR family regulator